MQFFEALGGGDWSVGPSGAFLGLRSEAFREIRLATGIRAPEWPQVLEDVRVMERAALEHMAHRQKMQGARNG